MNYSLGFPVTLPSLFCKTIQSLIAFALLIITSPASSAITTYTNETTYLAALNSLRYVVISEGFEDNGVWSSSHGSVSVPVSVSSISSQGLVWQSNRAGNGVATDNILAQGASSFRFYSSPHGKKFDINMQNGCDAAAVNSVPAACWQNDGWTISPVQAGKALYGVGGWFYSVSGAAKLTYLLDGADIIANNANHDGHRIASGWSFFGVIDTAGFSMAEIREMAGKAKAEQNFFGDSFSVGLAAATRVAQTITFTTPTGAFLEGTSQLNASASSGLGVNFSSATPSVCSVKASTVTYLSSGACTLVAKQAGDANFYAAPQVQISLSIAKADQQVTFNPAATGTVRVQRGLSATSSSGLAVSFASSTQTVCTVKGNTVNFVKAGTCTLLADQAGDSNYNAAPQVLANISVSLDAVAPVVTAPAAVTVSATGLKTAVNLGQGSAQDNLDGTITPVPDQTGPFVPGVYTVTWSATDQDGNTGVATQMVTVFPQISLGHDLQVSEGGTVNLTAYLNGSFPSTVSVPYTVSGSATQPADHNLVDGTLSFSPGKIQAVMPFNIVQDNIAEPDETVIVLLGTPTNATVGQPARQTITIRGVNLAPRVNLQIKQGALFSRSLTQKDANGNVTGNVTVIAVVRDSNPGDTHNYDWSMTDNALVDTDGNPTNATFVFDPSAVTEGVYAMQVTVTDNGSPALSNTTIQKIRIVLQRADLSPTKDSDGDTIPDAKEGYGDSDGDGLPDYLDASSVSNIFPVDARKPQGAYLETEPGLKLTLGQTAFSTKVMGGGINQNGLSSQDTMVNVGGIFDFVITDLAMVGDSATIILPLSAPIPIDSVYRILGTTGWQTFVQDNRNKINSAPGSQGLCPSPGDASYQAGLIAGYRCVALTIKDGGANDLDGLLNGVIVDPSGVAQIKALQIASPPSATTTPATTGGGSLQLKELLILFLLSLSLVFFGIIHRRRYS